MAHPFFSILTLMVDDGVQTRLAHVSDARRRIRNAYLAPWTKFEPMDRLVQAFAMAQKLSALHHALSFQQPPSIIRAHGWMAELVPFFLGFLVPEGESGMLFSQGSYEPAEIDSESHGSQQ